MGKIGFRIIMVLAITGLGIACGFAATQNTKATFKVSDAEIDAFLNNIKKTDPMNYNLFMQLKNTDSQQFEQAVCGGIVQERLKRSGDIVEQARRVQVEQMKVMYNISDKEIDSFLSKLNSADVDDYNSIIRLKSENPPAYEINLLGRILQYRRTGSLSLGAGINGGDTVASLAKIAQEISRKRGEWQMASRDAEKQKALAELKVLLAKSYEFSTSVIVEQIDNVDQQIKGLKKTIDERNRDRDKNIDAWLAQLTAEAK